MERTERTIETRLDSARGANASKSKNYSRNLFYWVAVCSAMMLTILSAVLYSCVTQTISLIYAIVAPLLVNGYTLVILGAVSLLLRVIVPKKCWNCERTYFMVRDRELKLYRILRVRKWKDRIPETGKAGGFQKRKIQSVQPDYIEKFLCETCLAEAIHFNAGILGFTALLFFRPDTMIVALPLVTVNFMLHVLPCVVQRFTRYRLYRIFLRLKAGAGNLVQPQKTSEDHEEKP